MEPRKKIRRILEGRVVSDKMAKTIVVKVTRLKIHPKYRKQYKVSTRYKVHDENKEYRVGDLVKFVECRPISKEKCWRVLAKAPIKNPETKS